MKILRIIFGISIGIIWMGYFNTHNFISATGVTSVYVIFIILIKKWICGEMDEIEYKNSTYPKGVLGFSGNDVKGMTKSCDKEK